MASTNYSPDRYHSSRVCYAEHERLWQALRAVQEAFAHHESTCERYIRSLEEKLGLTASKQNDECRLDSILLSEGDKQDHWYDRQEGCRKRTQPSTLSGQAQQIYERPSNRASLSPTARVKPEPPTRYRTLQGSARREGKGDLENAESHRTRVLQQSSQGRLVRRGTTWARLDDQSTTPEQSHLDEQRPPVRKSVAFALPRSFRRTQTSVYHKGTPMKGKYD